MNDKKMQIFAVGLVAAGTPVLTALIVLASVPFMLWNAWAIHVILRWHFPALTVGTVPLAVGLLLFRHIWPHPEKDEKWYAPFIRAAIVPPVLLLSGWILLQLRGRIA